MRKFETFKLVMSKQPQKPPVDERITLMVETQRMWREGYRMASPYLGRAWAALIACAGIGYLVCISSAFTSTHAF